MKWLWRTLQACWSASRFFASSGSPKVNLSAVTDDSRIIVLHCNVTMNQQDSNNKKNTKKKLAHVDVLLKSFTQERKLNLSILSAKPLCLVLKVISCWCCPVSVFPGIQSHIPLLWTRLCAAPRLNLPNCSRGPRQSGRLQEPSWAFPAPVSRQSKTQKRPIRIHPSWCSPMFVQIK